MRNYTTQLFSTSDTSTFIFIYSKKYWENFLEIIWFSIFHMRRTREREKRKIRERKWEKNFTSLRLERAKSRLCLYLTDIIKLTVENQNKNEWMNNIIGHLSNLLATFNTSRYTHMLLLLSCQAATYFYTTRELRRWNERRRQKYEINIDLREFGHIKCKMYGKLGRRRFLWVKYLKKNLIYWRLKIFKS